MWCRFRRLAPDDCYLWSGASCSSLYFFCALVSDQHWALCFVSLQLCDYMYLYFTVMFHWWCRGPFVDRPPIRNLDLHQNLGWGFDRFCSSPLFVNRLLLCRCILLMFFPHLFFFRCLGKTLLRDCGLSWVTSFIFLNAANDMTTRKHTYIILTPLNPTFI